MLRPNTCRPTFHILLGLALAIFFAAELRAVAPSIETRGLSLSQGLSDLLVNVIFKDSKGFVWLGTEQGVDRFDGNFIHPYSLEGDIRRSKRVMAITEGRHGDIYVGSQQGLYMLEAGATAMKKLEPKTIDFPVNGLAPDGHDKIFIGSRHGLFIYDENSGKLTQKLLVNDNMSEDNMIIALEVDGENGLWILTPRALWYMPFSGKEIYSHPLTSNKAATDLAEINGKVYMGTDGAGVVEFDRTTRRFSQPNMIGNGLISSLSETSEGNLLVTTDGEGVFIYSPGEGRVIANYSSANGLRSNAVYNAIEDSDGMMWVGYYQTGADYTPLQDSQVNRFNEHTGNTTVRAIGVSDNYVALGTHEGLFLYSTDGEFIKSFDKSQLGSNQIFTITSFGNKFLIGTYHGGMYSLDPSTMTLQSYGPAAMNEESVFIITVDGNNEVWVGTSAGVYRFSGGRETDAAIYSSANSQLPEGNVYEIFFDTTGRGWFCTEKGMAIWNGSQIRATGFPTGFINNMKIRAIYEDSNHNLYFAPDRGNIWKSDLSLLHFEPLKIGVDNRFAMFTSMIEGNDGTLWIGTDKGLVNLSDSGTFSIINNVGGVVNPTYTLAKPYKGSKGQILLGSTSGLHIIRIDSLKSNASTKVLQITNLMSNGKEVKADKEKELRLKASENDLSISVSDMKYHLPEFFEVEYICEGIDREWKTADGSRAITYYDIQPGNYTFRVRVPGHPESEYVMNIHKSAGFNWMILSIIIIVCVIFVGVIAFIAVYIRRRKEISLATESAASPSKNDEASTPKEVPYKTTRLSEEECKRLYRRLETVMKTERPYLNANLKSAELAKMVGTTSHALSFIFNQYLEISYYDYINKYRVEEFKRFVADSDISRYTLAAMAEKCGFSSRASFFRHFKSLTGMTPAEYINNSEGK